MSIFLLWGPTDLPILSVFRNPGQSGCESGLVALPWHVGISSMSVSIGDMDTQMLPRGNGNFRVGIHRRLFSLGVMGEWVLVLPSFLSPFPG